MPNDPIDVFVGARLRQLREARRISMERLGAAIGTSYQQVQKYEVGSNRTSASMLWRIAKTLGVSVGDFFVGLDGAKDEATPDWAALRTAAALQKVDPKIRSILAALIDAIANGRRDEQ